jgi:hypothetical protein
MINTRQYCVFFNRLTYDLQKSVKNICKNAPDKSKIYSNIENELDILISDGDLQRSARISTPFKTVFTSRLNNLITQKDVLDQVLKLYKQQSKINVDVDKNYFFLRLLQHCIREDKTIIQDNHITYDDESDSDIEKYLGGGKCKTKRKPTKRKPTKRCKTKRKPTKKLLL